MKREVYQVTEDESKLNTINYNGNLALLQSHISWQHRFSDKLILNSGIHYQNLTLNNASQVVEPRLGLKYRFSNRHGINFAYGHHHQSQPPTIYFVDTNLPDGRQWQTNRELGFTNSNHLVLGYDLMIMKDLKLVVEAYHQKLSNVPVQQTESTFSMLNYGADFGVPDMDSLVNNGTGRNYGMELTLEKYFNGTYYFLITASLFDSKYTASDGIDRNTAFNGNHVINGLFGKEWALGQKGNAILIDLKLTHAGNKRYIPIDLEASRRVGYTRYDYENAYQERYPNYFRADVKFTFRWQFTRLTQEFVLDIQNITGHENVYFQRYDPLTQEITTSYQMGFWPMFQYRILF
jgi:hypothetical protein